MPSSSSSSEIASEKTEILSEENSAVLASARNDDNASNESNDAAPTAPKDNIVSRGDIGQSSVHSIDDDVSITERRDFRGLTAKSMHSFSDFVNDHLVALRYSTFASIALLTAYSISKTPLLFRYKTVSDIPGSLFTSRKTLHGRLVRVIEEDSDFVKGDKEKPIICLVRHVSPIGRLLSRNAFDFFHRASPAATIGKRMDDEAELLKVEIAGVTSPPFYIAPSHMEQPGEWIRRLAEQRACVALKLLARRVKTRETTMAKRDAAAAFPELRDVFEKESIDPHDQIAVCRMGYRSGFSLFQTDVAMSMVRSGRAVVSSNLYVPDESRITVDATTRLEDLKSDAAYLEKVANGEFEAANKYLGMWADPKIRDDHKHTVDEANFQATANIFQRLWRWLRG